MSDIASTISIIRRLVQAIIDGRMEAKELGAMTDEQLAEYDAKLQAEAEAEVERAEELSREPETGH